MKRVVSVVPVAVFAAALAALSVGTVLWAAGTAPASGTAATAPGGGGGGEPAEVVHFVKARELYEQAKYQDALAEINQALAINPNYQDAKLYQFRINSALSGTPAGGTVGTGSRSNAPADLLTMEQVSRIRLLEYKDDETGIRGSIQQKTLEDFWATVVLKSPTVQDTSDGARRRFLDPSNLTEQVKMMRTLEATAFYSKVTISSDPATLVEFRTRVQPALIQNCATSGCHSGANNNGYRIFTPLPGQGGDRETYTNFFMMTAYSRGGGRMLDRDNPEWSLFLQYAMTKENAKYPHPGKAEVRSKITSETDERYVALVKWVKSLAYPTPKYGIPYKTAATAPASAISSPARSPAPSTTPARGPGR